MITLLIVSVSFWAPMLLTLLFVYLFISVPDLLACDSLSCFLHGGRESKWVGKRKRFRLSRPAFLFLLYRLSHGWPFSLTSALIRFLYGAKTPLVQACSYLMPTFLLLKINPFRFGLDLSLGEIAFPCKPMCRHE